MDIKEPMLNISLGDKVRYKASKNMDRRHKKLLELDEMSTRSYRVEKSGRDLHPGVAVEEQEEDILSKNFLNLKYE